MSHQYIKEVHKSTYRKLFAGAGKDIASMVDNEQLKCTATLPL